MNLIQSFLTKNPCYTCGRTITPTGLMLHSVGCPQPSAAVFVKNWNRADYDRACVHAFIDGNTGDDEANGGVVARKRRSLRYVGGAARPAYEEAGPCGGQDGEREDDMRIFQYVDQVPLWAREAARKAVVNGYIRMDAAGAMTLYEMNLQPLVWLDRAGLLDAPAGEVG